jgi:Tol biopolymer transport system component
MLRPWCGAGLLVLTALAACGSDHPGGPRDAVADQIADRPATDAPGDQPRPSDLGADRVDAPPVQDVGDDGPAVDVPRPDGGVDGPVDTALDTMPDMAPMPDTMADATPDLAPVRDAADAADTASLDPTCATGARRATTSASGEQGQGVSAVPVVSGDGRYVAFSSLASNLVPNDLNGRHDVFVKDMHTGAIERVSVSSAGVEGNDDSGEFSAGTPIAMTADARFVAFASIATNLVSGDTNNNADVFLRDRLAGTTVRISVTSAGTQVAGDSRSPSISADGQRIAFSSSAPGYDSRDTNGDVDVYVHDRATGMTRLLSLAEDHAAVGVVPVISADGHKVAFYSSSGLYLPVGLRPSPFPINHVYVADVDSGAIIVVSLTTGALGNGNSTYPALNADGHIVAFSSIATNLVAGDTNGVEDIFVRDTVANTTTRVSVRADGTQAPDSSTFPAVDSTGNRVAFHSRNLAGGSAPYADVFVRDRALGTTFLVSRGLNGFSGSSYSLEPPGLTANGGLAVYSSNATNIVVGDTNAAKDVFLSAVGCP